MVRTRAMAREYMFSVVVVNSMSSVDDQVTRDIHRLPAQVIMYTYPMHPLSEYPWTIKLLGISLVHLQELSLAWRLCGHHDS